ncbi:radical SAM protein [Candidatus Neomarinimicrobiota bacterium]
MRAFGPVPSRRLGQSLGINNLPPKVCTYSCVYCQLGRTTKLQVDRQVFYNPDEILADVQEQIKATTAQGVSVDYLTFVSNGEPTLDVNLGLEIELLKSLGFKIAVISNAALMWRGDVRDDLMKADWISLKVDAAREEIWREIDRPHGRLQLTSILDGILEFRKEYRGELVTETMLIEGVNESSGHIEEVANYLARLRPATSYLSIPTRPPGEEWVRSPDEEVVYSAYRIFCEKIASVEHLLGYEGNAFAWSGDVEKDLLSITAVHPMREESVNEFLARAKADWSVISKLIDQNHLVELTHEGQRFYMRRLPGVQPR